MLCLTTKEVTAILSFIGDDVLAFAEAAQDCGLESDEIEALLQALTAEANLES